MILIYIYKNIHIIMYNHDNLINTLVENYYFPMMEMITSMTETEDANKHN